MSDKTPDIPAEHEQGETPTESSVSFEDKRRKPRFSLRELVCSLGLVLVVFFVFHVVLGFVPVKGASMRPLINSDGDQSWSVLCRLAGPEKGSVVVFPKVGAEVNLIKRVIATEGDEVVVRPKASAPEYAEIYVNGTLLDEPYLGEQMYWSLWVYSDLTHTFVSPIWHEYGTITSNEQYVSFTVPEGKFFALGDNRNDSRDSRHYGFFDVDECLGRVFLLVDGSGLRLI